MLKKITLLCSILLFVTDLAAAKEYMVEKKVADLVLTMTIDRNPPIVGDNQVAIAIVDAANKAVTDAQVTLEYSMPPMPGMPPGRYKAAMALKDGLYRAPLNLTMSGSWNITVKVDRAGKATTAKFTIDAK